MESDEFEHVLATERAAKMAKAMNFEKRDGDAAQQGALPVSPFAAHLERLRALVLADGATGMGRLPAEDVAAIEALIARWDMAVRLYQEWQQAVGRLGAVLFG